MQEKQQTGDDGEDKTYLNANFLKGIQKDIAMKISVPYKPVTKTRLADVAPKPLKESNRVAQQSYLVTLPRDVLHTVITFLGDKKTLGKLALTCVTLREAVYSNEPVWEKLFKNFQFQQAIATHGFFRQPVQPAPIDFKKAKAINDTPREKLRVGTINKYNRRVMG